MKSNLKDYKECVETVFAKCPGGWSTMLAFTRILDDAFENVIDAEKINSMLKECDMEKIQLDTNSGKLLLWLYNYV